MDQIQNNSSANSTNNSASNSPSTGAARQRQLQLQHLQQQRLLVQQQQQQLYNLLPQAQASSYSPHTALPPVPTAQSASLQSQYFTEDLQSPTHTSPPNSASLTLPTGWPSAQHRTSNSREELHPSHQQQRQYEQEQQQYHLQLQQREQQLQQHEHQQRQHHQQQQQLKHEREEVMSYAKKDEGSMGSTAGPSTGSQPPQRSSEDPMPSTSDFVKKLYKMLEDPSFQSVVCWGPQGDCFVVKDMNEFTKSILPRMFKHSNFASFVRQLNKYDFHKVKNTDDNQFGEHSWTFRHPDFHADRRDALENIKRKVPAQRKNAGNATSGAPLHTNGTSVSYGSQPSTSPSLSYPLSNSNGQHRQRSPSPTNSRLTAEVARLKEEGEDLRARIRNLERNYEKVLVEMVGFQRGMAQQDGLMQNLIAYFLGSESGKQKSSSTATPAAHAGSNVAQSPQIGMGAPDAMSGSKGPQPSGSSSAPGTANLTPHQLLKQQIQAHLQQQSQTSPAQSYASGMEQPGIGLWSGMNYTVSGGAEASSSSGTGAAEGQAAQKISRAEALSQIRDLHRERLNQGGWASIPQPPAGMGMDVSSGLEALDRMRTDVGARPQSLGRTGGFSEEKERERAFARSISRDRAAMEEEEKERGRQVQRRRASDTTAFLRSGSLAMGTGEEGSNQPAFAMPSISQPQPQSQAQHRLSEDQRQGQDRAPTQSPWSMMMAGMSGFGDTSSAGTTDASRMGREELQVYTVGHLLPRDSYAEDSQGNWSFDPNGFAPATLLGGLGMDAAGPSTSANNASPAAGTTPAEAGESSIQDLTDDVEEVVRPTPGNAVLSSSSSGPSSSSSMASGGPEPSTSGGSQKLRVRRSTFVPGWAVPPRVLLVDDDAISRRLSSKFLKVFGCTIDVAVDGISAVNKMNLEKYDLVLMDIVMPKLDGVSATNLIRKFDQGTPIISMTGNSKPNEIMTYYSSGMNDILPKPFTKEGLLEMLEKHLMHLKVIQQMTQVPRSVGVPPLSDPSFEQALAMSANNFMQMQKGSSASPRPITGAITPALDLVASSSKASEGAMNAPSPFNFQFFGDGSDDDPRINPLAGMGLTDEQYNMILQNIVNGEGFMGMSTSMASSSGGGMASGSSPGGGVSEKRPLEDGEDDRRGKRSRFEVIE